MVLTKDLNDRKKDKKTMVEILNVVESKFYHGACTCTKVQNLLRLHHFNLCGTEDLKPTQKRNKVLI